MLYEVITVFGLDVIRAFASLDQLRYFETTHQNFQREIDTPHLNELVTFLKDKLYRFFPEIVIAIKNYAELIDMKLISDRITSYNVCYTKLLRIQEVIHNNLSLLLLHL